MGHQRPYLTCLMTLLMGLVLCWSASAQTQDPLVACKASCAGLQGKAGQEPSQEELQECFREGVTACKGLSIENICGTLCGAPIAPSAAAPAPTPSPPLAAAPKPRKLTPRDKCLNAREPGTFVTEAVLDDAGQPTGEVKERCFTLAEAHDRIVKLEQELKNRPSLTPEQLAELVAMKNAQGLSPEDKRVLDDLMKGLIHACPPIEVPIDKAAASFQAEGETLKDPGLAAAHTREAERLKGLKSKGTTTVRVDASYEERCRVFADRVKTLEERVENAIGLGLKANKRLDDLFAGRTRLPYDPNTDYRPTLLINPVVATYFTKGFRQEPLWTAGIEAEYLPHITKELRLVLLGGVGAGIDPQDDGMVLWGGLGAAWFPFDRPVPTSNEKCFAAGTTRPADVDVKKCYPAVHVADLLTDLFFYMEHRARDEPLSFYGIMGGFSLIPGAGTRVDYFPRFGGGLQFGVGGMRGETPQGNTESFEDPNFLFRGRFIIAI